MYILFCRINPKSRDVSKSVGDHENLVQGNLFTPDDIIRVETLREDKDTYKTNPTPGKYTNKDNQKEENSTTKRRTRTPQKRRM